MRQYRLFISCFLVVLALYIIAELNRPKPINWTVTLTKGDKNPFGSFILYERLNDIFPKAQVESYRTPVYNQVNNYSGDNTTYILRSQSMPMSENDVDELFNYVAKGNYVLLSASELSKPLLDTLHLDTELYLSPFTQDSVSINFTEPSLASPVNYTFKKGFLNEYFSKLDTASTTILGTNNKQQANLVRIQVGKGFFIVHANPLVFSNYFMLHQNNAAYTAAVLSQLPEGVEKIMWDEYYNLGRLGAATPLRFFLSNDYLRWALRLAIIGMLLYVLFEMKRRQRVIPIITPLKNTTVAFIKTIATVFLQQKDNRSVAGKKITYFLELVRNKYFIATTHLNDEFVDVLSRKSGVERDQINELVQMIYTVQQVEQLPDKHLLVLNNKIDNFYKQVQ